MKDRLNEFIEKIKDFIHSIDGQSYRELKNEWEEQNALIDSLNSNISKINRRYKNLTMVSYIQTVLYTKTKNENKRLRAEIRRLKAKNKK